MATGVATLLDLLYSAVLPEAILAVEGIIEDHDLGGVVGTVVQLCQKKREGEGALVAAGGFADMTHWPVTISFFEKRDVRADATPDFMLTFLLYENGISRSYLIDFGEFELRGRLTSLEMLPVRSCD